MSSTNLSREVALKCNKKLCNDLLSLLLNKLTWSNLAAGAWFTRSSHMSLVDKIPLVESNHALVIDLPRFHYFKLELEILFYGISALLARLAMKLQLQFVPVEFVIGLCVNWRFITSRFLTILIKVRNLILPLLLERVQWKIFQIFKSGKFTNKNKFWFGELSRIQSSFIFKMSKKVLMIKLSSDYQG